MRGLFLCACAILAAAAAPAASQDQAVEQYRPSSPWHLDGSEERCRLARRFGDDSDSVMLLIEVDEPTQFARFVIAGPAMDKIATRDPVRIEFGNLEPVVLEQYRMGSLEGFGTALLTSGIDLSKSEEEDEDDESEDWVDTRYDAPGLPIIPTERFGETQTLAIVQDGEARTELVVSNFSAALSALNQCAENFVTHWGLDLEQHRTRLRGPKWLNYRRIVQRIVARYPERALQAREQGTIRFRLMVDENGAVTGCEQSDATLMKRLDAPICNTVRHAKFDPALDANGDPMPSYYAGAVRYALP